MGQLVSRVQSAVGTRPGPTLAASSRWILVATAALVLWSAAIAASCSAPPDGAAAPTVSPRSTGDTAPAGSAPAVGLDAVLILTATRGFRHESIEPAARALDARLTSEGLAVEITDDPGALTAEGLAGVDVVVFLSTTGDVLDDEQQDALQAWVEGGGGWVGIHGALDAEYDWPFYETLAGAWFQVHPAVQEATVRVEDPTHPATAHLPAAWVRTDEWYDLRSNPRGNADVEVHVVATLDEATYEGGVMGPDHPIAWCARVGAGQTFVTAMGHTVESWSEPAFVDHVVGGIRSVADLGSCA